MNFSQHWWRKWRSVKLLILASCETNVTNRLLLNFLSTRTKSITWTKSHLHQILTKIVISSFARQTRLVPAIYAQTNLHIWAFASFCEEKIKQKRCYLQNFRNHWKFIVWSIPTGLALLESTYCTCIRANAPLTKQVPDLRSTNKYTVQRGILSGAERILPSNSVRLKQPHITVSAIVFMYSIHISRIKQFVHLVWNSSEFS